ncbi:response regulator [Spirosoma sp. KNUC1025]|uniref:response regulator transcription factor n=1 Tax=Spirosoma sp. KNUC1025 TaxID=2894082 RepID=UPI00386F4D7B|nr:response regulator [Spirosoma sp. KNUC1025]
MLPIQPISIDTEAPKIILSAREQAAVERPPVAVPEKISEPSVLEADAPLLLIVEDNTELREFLASELSATYRILRATDGLAGWQITQIELPDIVITDVMMPRMDGYELTRLIKNNPDTDHIAVVMLTAKASHQSRIEGLREGADDYLAKPFHLDELHLRLRNLILHQQRLRDQYRQQLAQPELPSPINVVEDAFLHRVYNLLETNLSDSSLDVNWLADQVAMSRKTLYRKTHSLVQLAPNELIRQYRLRKAADLLQAGHSASETAHLVGFKTPSYFTTVFKEFYHKTPSEFAAGGLNKV